jgi:hypothetical protein
MEKKNIHLVEADVDTQRWIEHYTERKNLSIKETLDRMLRAGRSALERQEIEIANLSKGDPELPPRVKIGVQASVECLSILRKVYLPELDDQKRLAFEVKELIEKAIRHTVNEREDVVS